MTSKTNQSVLTLSADQTTNISAGNRVNWDQIQGAPGIVLDTVTTPGQIEIPARGRRYLLILTISNGFSTPNSSFGCSWYDVDNAESLPNPADVSSGTCVTVPITRVVDNSFITGHFVIFTTDVSRVTQTIEVRIEDSTNMTSISERSTACIIEV